MVTRVMSLKFDSYVFDLYGTLVDIGSLAARLEPAFGEHARAALDLWRAKQLGYAFAASMMEHYEDFARLTAYALEYTAAKFAVELDASARVALVDLWSQLPTYGDVPQTLAALRSRGARLAVLSNGTPSALARTLAAAGIAEAFDHVISVDAARVYKPAPRVYELALAAFEITDRAAIAFVSSNGWDATGAAAFGFSAVWCNRTGMPPEPFGPPPVATIDRLAALVAGDTTSRAG